MTEYYEEGGLLYEHSPPKHIKEESPEGPCGGGISEDGFPREDEDSEGSCDNNGSLPDGLPFNVVVVHPNVVPPGLASDDLFYTEQNRGVSSSLAAGGGGKRKSRFSGAELEVLVSEVTRCEGELFGPAGRLRRRERERIWAGILERVNAVSRVPRTLREVKKRWDDLKRRNGGRLADARYRSCYVPSSRGSSSVLGRSSTQASPRLQKQSSRGKSSSMSFSDTDAVGGEGSERDGFEKDDDTVDHDREDVDGECGDGGENSMDDKLGLGLGLGIVPPPTSERWLPPSPLYSAPFLNGTPQPSPQPSLGGHQGLLEAPAPRVSWLEDELRGLGEAAVRLGDRVEHSLREFGEGFRHDMRTLVASQEALSVSLQQNNLLLQRLLGLLESQQQQAQQAVQAQPPQPHHPHPQPHPHPHPHQHPQQHPQVPQQPQPQPQPQQLQHLPIQQNQALQQPTQQEELQGPAAVSSDDQPQPPPPPSPLSSEPPPPNVLDGTARPDAPAAMNGMSQRSRRGRTVEQRRRRRR